VLGIVYPRPALRGAGAGHRAVGFALAGGGSCVRAAAQPVVKRNARIIWRTFLHARLRALWPAAGSINQRNGVAAACHRLSSGAAAWRQLKI
jgi:hypothetical protein